MRQFKKSGTGWRIKETAWSSQKISRPTSTAGSRMMTRRRRMLSAGRKSRLRRLAASAFLAVMGILEGESEGFEVSTITGLMTVDEYEAKVASGEIPEDSRVELIDGRLVRKVTKNPPHTYSIFAVRDATAALMPPGWHVRQEGPVRVPPLSEPEPDISVVRGTAKTYKKRHPGPTDIALIVEVADSSLADDRTLAVTYGAAGIPVYWIVNLRDRQVEVYTDPDPAAGYRSRVDYQPGQDVPVVIEGQEVGQIAVADLLP